MHRKKVAILIASIDREYQQEFVGAAAAVCAQHDFDLCVFNSQGHTNVTVSTSEEKESNIYSLPDMMDFDAVISLPATMGSDITIRKMEEILKPIRKAGKPHVSIDVPAPGAVTIQFDDKVSMEELTEHLIRQHHVKHIAFVSGPSESSVSLARYEACCSAMKRHGLNPNDHLVFDGEWTRVGGRKAAEAILNMGGELPDAVICANDDMALSVVETFGEHDIRVPQDVLVTGFDSLSEAVLRGMTTICRPVDRCARRAVEILDAWMNGAEPAEKTITLSTIPVYGESCGCNQKVEHIHEKLRTMGSERWNMETILNRMSMFSGMMAGIGDEAEAEKQVRILAKEWNIREFYLCVDPALCRNEFRTAEENGFPDNMLLLFGVRNGKEYPRMVFPTRDLVPSLKEMRKHASCLVFCPLYARGKNFGYLALNPGTGTGAALYPLMMLLNGALMSLYLQNNIRQYAAEIERMAVHDIMTGMLNRRGYMDLAPAEMEKAKRTDSIFVLLSADMDHMKEINDRFGHLKGDEAIIRFGRAMNILTKHGITPVHISGDEFLAYGIVSSLEEAFRLKEYVDREVERLDQEEPWIRKNSASIGIYAAVPREGDELDDFLTRADRAMYAEKQKKKTAALLGKE